MTQEEWIEKYSDLWAGMWLDAISRDSTGPALSQQVRGMYHKIKNYMRQAAYEYPGKPDTPKLSPAPITPPLANGKAAQPQVKK
jgi:hypothetical protein